jgi:GTP cyclohydrolase I
MLKRGHMSTRLKLDAILENGTGLHENGSGSGHSALTVTDAALKLPDVAFALQDASLQEIYAEVLRRIGEDPTRDGLASTPKRMEKSMAFLTQGYQQSVDEVLHGALFDVDYDEMVMVKDIEFYSLCEHHLLPFFGKAHIAYVPQGKVVGLSKLPRIVDVFARRLQVQERLTQQIAEAIEDAIQPQGVGVVMEAQHLCMMMRGVEKQSSATVTSSMRGVFKTQLQTRNEFLSLVRPER